MIWHIESVAHRLGFTRHEALVVMFLSAVVSVGALLQYLEGAPARPSFRQAYQRHDSTFAARSATRLPAPADDSASMHIVRLSDTLKHPGTVNINTASAAELTKLPGVGPATAKKILTYRNEVGKFKKIEDIMKVKSIGRKKFERMSALICVD